MNAVVKFANKTRGMYAAKADEGGFVIFELMDSREPQIGDTVSGSFLSMGSGTYRNLTQGEKFAVYTQNFVNTVEMAKKQCFLA